MTLPYSTRFFGNQYAVGQLPVYTVPSGWRIVVRSVSVAAGGAGLSGFILYGANAVIFQGSALPANGFAQWHGRQVVNGGEALTLNLSGQGAYVMASGYLLSDS